MLPLALCGVHSEQLSPALGEPRIKQVVKISTKAPSSEFLLGIFKFYLSREADVILIIQNSWSAVPRIKQCSISGRVNESIARGGNMHMSQRVATTNQSHCLCLKNAIMAQLIIHVNVYENSRI